MNKILRDLNIPTSNHNLVPNHNLQHPTHYSSPNSSNYENNPQTSNNPTHIFTSTNPLIVTSFNNHIIPQPASHHHNPTPSYNSNSAYPLIPLTHVPSPHMPSSTQTSFRSPISSPSTSQSYSHPNYNLYQLYPSKASPTSTVSVSATFGVNL